MRQFTALLFAAFVSPFLLSACDRPGNRAEAPQGQSADLELRVYQVPAEETDKLRAAVYESLGIDEKSRIGSVSSPVAGQLLVLAPRRLCRRALAARCRSLRRRRRRKPPQ